jgi:predicted transposase/invertase (TIGR01784 family)
MRKLSLSKKYVPGYLQVEQLKKEAQKIGEEQGEKRGLEKGRRETFKEMAKKMKDKGTAIEFISEITGLSKEEIEKL